LEATWVHFNGTGNLKNYIAVKTLSFTAQLPGKGGSGVERVHLRLLLTKVVGAVCGVARLGQQLIHHSTVVFELVLAYGKSSCLVTGVVDFSTVGILRTALLFGSLKAIEALIREGLGVLVEGTDSKL